MLVHMGAKVLGRYGHQVTTTTSSEEALALVAADPGAFDVLITDQTMPVLVGMELARRVSAIRADLPILLCTGQSARVTMEEALAVGIRGVVQKPFDVAALAAAVQAVSAGRLYFDE